MECAQFCGRFGWSKEKYRKVSQRARARLRELLAARKSESEKIFARRCPVWDRAVGEGDRDRL